MEPGTGRAPVRRSRCLRLGAGGLPPALITLWVLLRLRKYYEHLQ
ncbi:hypothetical protein B932_0980 [Gluconobacter oxydans H24]|nr:hypothetical protein B932_0980 [Gluconobacter oxydans H24]